jgi:demethylmenaquinone methyltransferase/2-methoxy-6-polyprenyl-1,4-benzoquinol methylase
VLETDSKSSAMAVTGTVPEGASNEVEASSKVREMFTQIAPRYDVLNHVLSLELDRLWRARVTRRMQPILQRSDAVVLDLCCGTGDLVLSFAKRAKARLIGADFAHPMVVRAREKSVQRGSRRGREPVFFLEADALNLPFAEDSFDLVTTAFGFRNLANYQSGLREIFRVLKPGGTLAILEFTEPPDNFLGDLYRWYFRNVLPRIGGLLSGDRAAYQYLPKSVSRFLVPEALCSLMKSADYRSVEFVSWTFGTVCLHTGKK